jgi:VIT1/CCC1 family predicted Fe2+/Mn2+ transporter
MQDENKQPTLESLDAQIAQLKRETTHQTVATSQWWTAESAMTISAIVLAFGVFIIVIAALMIKWGSTAESTLRVVGTLVILIAAVFLVVAGYSDKQIAPVMGLLGTVAGYLLGKSSKDA